ncbi:MAG: hypothetical protein KHX56_09960 [Clostridiales bacterium]|nr:hypothetical protein [Clostridiales bacterium]
MDYIVINCNCSACAIRKAALRAALPRMKAGCSVPVAVYAAAPVGT